MFKKLVSCLVTLMVSSFVWSQGIARTGPFNPDPPSNPGSYKVQLIANPTEGGTVSGQGQYAQGTNVVIKATPNGEFLFRGWSDGVKDAQRTIVVGSNDTTIVAVFVENVYPETVICTVVNESPFGTVSFTSEVIKNTTISLKADAPECSKFVKWSDNTTSNPRSVVMTKDSTFIALFEKTQFTITIDTEDPKKGEVDVHKVVKNEK